MTLGILSLGSLGPLGLFKFGSSSAFKALFLQHLAQHLLLERSSLVHFCKQVAGKCCWLAFLGQRRPSKMVKTNWGCVALGRGEILPGAADRGASPLAKHAPQKRGGHDYYYLPKCLVLWVSPSPFVGGVVPRADAGAVQTQLQIKPIAHGQRLRRQRFLLQRCHKPLVQAGILAGTQGCW